MNGCPALAVFKALADETRLRLYRLLTRFELNVGEIVGVLGMGQSRISRHLRILVESGLLTARRDGLWVFYSAPDTPLRAAVEPLAGDCGPPEDLARARQCLDARALETRRFFNAIAPDWRAMRREVLGELDLDGLILSLTPTCAKAADLGCGPGDLLEALGAKAASLVGVDASSAMLELARRKPGLALASLRVGELEHLPLADAEVQAAVLSLTLHHLSDPAAALREARRVLAPGGTLVVADYLKHGDERLRERFGDRWLGFSRDEMSRWLGEAGLTLERFEERNVNNGLALGVYAARRPETEETK
ncbi:Arsenic resistance transcriptional regulator ArsR1 [Fundidesulfovibrio magnetotacticus]|uniref:Arsenic resistance transcriptional regulator ArsR1 n=1 Tax=Fundidesulfovibrio magnetotacticus TaxID=2730080 RepID=A0A6V8LS65_9BACT|nr:metalloregulator ArsR/SmtB family transcription factor [Fundidesulfovibrio magnetotacticus]GFK93411.1 Arsenic resistance transcriptional regulator ArsR1 [Fundidesulfovibrio magnetotacticus]